MAIIVDKVQKRKDIALACKELFIEKGIAKLTIADVAKTAGIGKGTVYEYFKNKEDIIFEIVNILLDEKNQRKQKQIDDVEDSKEKLKVFFDTFYSEEDADLRKLYKEFISASLVNPNEEMIEYQSKQAEFYYEWFTDVLQIAIDRGELHPDAIKLSRGLFAFGHGLFIDCETTNSINNYREEVDLFLDTIFSFMEVK